MQACSSSSFTKRQYLSGRYLEKIEKPEKVRAIKMGDFDFKEYPLSADVNNDFNVTEFREDTIPKTVSDTITKKEDDRQDEINPVNPDNISNTEKTEQNKSDEDSQKLFNERLINAVIKTLIAGLLCLISFLGMFVFFLIILPLVVSGYVLPFIIFIPFSILLLIAKIFLVFASFKSLNDARKIAEANKGIKNKVFTYIVILVNVIISLIILGFWFIYFFIIFILLASLL
jgi:hypothetical protein